MKKILIATGSEILNEGLAQRLQGKYDVQLCFESDSVIEALERGRPDVLIINLCLPYITGLEVFQRATFKPSAVIALTPFLTNYIVDEAQAAGVGALVRLPCSINCVISHLNEILPFP